MNSYKVAAADQVNAMADVVLYFSFAGLWVLAYTAAAVLRGLLNAEATRPLGALVPGAVLLLNAAVALWFLIKVVVLNNENAPSSQFASLSQQLYPLLALGVNTLAAAYLLGVVAQDRETPDFDTSLAFPLTYFAAMAALGFWLALQNPNAFSIDAQGVWAANAKEPYVTNYAYDIVAMVAFGLFVFPFYPVVTLTERPGGGKWMWVRFCVADRTNVAENYEQLQGVYVLQIDTSREVIVAWSALQAYVSLKYFLDAPRFAADVVLVGLLPVVVSSLVTERWRCWLHFRIVMENARWIAFCAFPSFSAGTLSWQQTPGVFVYSQWVTSDYQTIEGSLLFFSISALVYIVIYYLVPLRRGVPFLVYHARKCCSAGQGKPRAAPRPAQAAPPAPAPPAPSSGLSDHWLKQRRRR